MSCCNNKYSNDTNKAGHKSHWHPMWMMLLCCGAPIIVLAVISVLGTTLAGIRTFLTGILPFVCPLIMLIMMPMMFIGNRKNKQCHKDHTADLNQLEEKDGGKK